jgi:hypothetical protein
MLSALKEKIAQHLLADAMKGVFGNDGAIREEKRSNITAMLSGLFPALQEAVDREVGVVRDRLVSCERECVLAAEEAKIATGITFRATETLLSSLDAVHLAEARILGSQKAVIRAEANLKSARDEFAKLVEKTRG